MIATLGTALFVLVVIVIVDYVIARAIVEVLDRLGLLYDPNREDGTVSFPAELLEEGHVIRRQPVAVGPGRLTLAAHGRKVALDTSRPTSLR